MSSVEALNGSKKQLRVLKVFIIMYVAFSLSATAQSVLALMDTVYTSVMNEIFELIFITTSVFNPTITLFLRPAFRLKFSKLITFITL